MLRGHCHSLRMQTIAIAMTATTTVRVRVAKLELRPSTPSLPKIAVSPARRRGSQREGLPGNEERHSILQWPRCNCPCAGSAQRGLQRSVHTCSATSSSAFAPSLARGCCICATGVVRYFLLQLPLEPTLPARCQTASPQGPSPRRRGSSLDGIRDRTDSSYGEWLTVSAQADTRQMPMRPTTITCERKRSFVTLAR